MKMKFKIIFNTKEMMIIIRRGAKAEIILKNLNKIHIKILKSFKTCFI